MRTSTIYRVFVSGPSDVAQDIEIAREIISDVSLLTDFFGVRFETFYWSDDVTPGLGTEPQERINNQAGDYDLFLAIIGERVGSPTKNYQSGTFEEVERALVGANKSIFGKNSVMVYFKETKISNKTADLESLLKINHFRDDIGNRGVLYKYFTDEFDLRKFIIKSFGNIIKIYLDSFGFVRPSIEVGASDLASEFKVSGAGLENDVDNDMGILELIEIVSKHMAAATNFSNSISTAINNLGINAVELTKELGVSLEVGDAVSQAKIINKFSSEMDNCSLILEGSVDGVLYNVKAAIAGARKVLEIRILDMDYDIVKNENQEFINVIILTGSSARGNINIFEKFQDTIQAIPRVSKKINMSKIRLLKVNELMIDMFYYVADECDDLAKFYSSLLKAKNLT